MHMKYSTKLSFLAAAAAVFTSGSALADDQQSQHRLAIQRAQNPEKSTTVAIYADRRGVSRSRTMSDQPASTRFELRSNARGQQMGVFVPEK